MPLDQGWGRGRRPVINVSWNDAQHFVRSLSSKTGKRYRLLTEAEWEYVARAGTTSPFSSGDNINSKQANYASQFSYPYGVTGSPDAPWWTVPVGSYQPNGFGLYDMHGNVWEWTEDCWHRSYDNAPSDGSAWLTGDCRERVVRGGSFIDSPMNIRSAVRSYYEPTRKDANIGFRIFRMD